MNYRLFIDYLWIIGNNQWLINWLSVEWFRWCHDVTNSDPNVHGLVNDTCKTRDCELYHVDLKRSAHSESKKCHYIQSLSRHSISCIHRVWSYLPINTGCSCVCCDLKANHQCQFRNKPLASLKLQVVCTGQQTTSQDRQPLHCKRQRKWDINWFYVI